MDKHKRRRLIVDPGFQYAFIRKICLMAAIMVGMSLAFLALVHLLYGDIQLQLIQPDPFSTAEGIDTAAQQPRLLNLLWPVMLICLVATLAVTFFFGLLLSHRMAGPIFRMRRTMNEMAAGDLRGQIHLRPKDEFTSLAESINDLRADWRRSIMEIEEIRQTIEKADAGKLAEGLGALGGRLEKFKI